MQRGITVKKQKGENPESAEDSGEKREGKKKEGWRTERGTSTLKRLPYYQDAQIETLAPTNRIDGNQGNFVSVALPKRTMEYSTEKRTNQGGGEGESGTFRSEEGLKKRKACPE